MTVSASRAKCLPGGGPLQRRVRHQCVVGLVPARVPRLVHPPAKQEHPQADSTKAAFASPRCGRRHLADRSDPVFLLAGRLLPGVHYSSCRCAYGRRCTYADLTLCRWGWSVHRRSMDRKRQVLPRGGTSAD